MTIMRRPSPFGELVSLRQAMDRLFEESFVRPRQWVADVFLEGGAMPLDIQTTVDELLVEAALPGLKPEEVDITIEGGTLTISGEHRTERKDEDESYLVHEIRRGSVSRSISLPEGLEPDRATASFANGILSLRIPKAEQVKPRQIKINAVGSEGTTTDVSPG
jgi:HSP20 family protein